MQPQNVRSFSTCIPTEVWSAFFESFLKLLLYQIGFSPSHRKVWTKHDLYSTLPRHMPHAYTIVVTGAHRHNQSSVAASKTNIRIPQINHSIYINAPPQTLEQRSKPISAFPIYWLVYEQGSLQWLIMILIWLIMILIWLGSRTRNIQQIIRILVPANSSQEILYSFSLKSQMLQFRSSLSINCQHWPLRKFVTTSLISSATSASKNHPCEH